MLALSWHSLSLQLPTVSWDISRRDTLEGKWFCHQWRGCWLFLVYILSSHICNIYTRFGYGCVVGKLFIPHLEVLEIYPDTHNFLSLSVRCGCKNLNSYGRTSPTAKFQRDLKFISLILYSKLTALCPIFHSTGAEGSNSKWAHSSTICVILTWNFLSRLDILTDTSSVGGILSHEAVAKVASGQWITYKPAWFLLVYYYSSSASHL